MVLKQLVTALEYEAFKEMDPRFLLIPTVVGSSLVLLLSCSPRTNTIDGTNRNIIKLCEEKAGTYDSLSAHSKALKECISKLSASTHKSSPLPLAGPQTSTDYISEGKDSDYIYCRINQPNIQLLRRQRSELLGPAVALRNQFGEDDPRAIEAQKNYDDAVIKLRKAIPASFLKRYDLDRASLIFSKCNKSDFYP